MGLPVNIDSRSISDVIALEGEPWSDTNYFTGNLTLAQTTNYQIGSITCRTNRAVWIETVSIYSNTNVDVQAIFDYAQSGGENGLVRAMVKAGDTVVIPVRQLVKQSSMQAAGNLGSVTLRGVYDSSGVAVTAGVNGCVINVSVHGVCVYNEFDFQAPRCIFAVGDSILNNTGATDQQTDWVYKIRQYYRGKGVRCRVSMKSKSGSTSSDHAGWLAGGLYDSAPRANLIIYQPMTNDAGQSIPTATYLANAQAFVSWAQMMHPQATVLIVGTHGLENDTSETNAAAMRAAVSAWVTAQEDAKLKYVSLAGAFDRKVTSNFASTDTPGSRVHPSDAGRNAIWGVLQTWLNSNLPMI